MELHPAHRPKCKGLAELGNPVVVRLHEVRLIDRHRIVACRPAQLMRDSTNDHFTDHLVGGGAAELGPAAARSKDHVVDPRGDRSARLPDVGESLSERGRKHARDPGRRRIAGVRSQRAHVDFYTAHRARKRESADRRAGAGKRDRAEDAERGAARNLECGHRNLLMRAWSSARGSPRRLFTSLAPLRKTPTGGLLFPAGEELFSVDLELKAIVGPDLTFRATTELANHRPSGRPWRPFLLGSAARWRLPGRSSLLLSGGINDGVAESHRRVAIATPRGPPTSPRAAPNARGFFASGLGPPFLSRSGGIKARLAESTRCVPHQRDPQTRRRNDAMAWSTPEIREVCVGMEVTSYLSAEM